VPLAPSTYFGINGVGLLHHPKDKEQNRRRWELMTELGVKWDRSDLWWSHLEKKPGDWNFEVSDTAMKAYRDHGVQMFPILDYGAAWRNGNAPATDEERAEFGNYVTQVVSRYRGSAEYWEAWNEPNILPFWKPQPNAELYAPLLRLTYDRVKAADPAAKVVGFALAGLDPDFLQRVLEIAGANCFDAVSYHFYRIGQPEERTLDEIGELKLMLEQFGRKDVPIWVTEMGVTSHASTEGVSEDLQAIYLMRQILLCIAAGAERVFPFCMVDNAWDPGGPWGMQLGMVRQDWRKKPVFYAYKAMIAELQDYEMAGRVDAGEGVYAYLFHLRAGASGVEHKLVAWTTNDVRDLRIDVDDIATTTPRAGEKKTLSPIPSELRNYTTLQGERRALEFDGATARVMLSPSPVYIPVYNRQLVQGARAAFDPPQLQAAPGQAFTAVLRGPKEAGEPGKLRVSAPPGWTARVEGNRVVVQLPSLTPTNKWATVHATVANSSGTISKDLRVWVREALDVAIRPFATTASQEIVTSITVHNQAVRASTRYEFTCTPTLPEITLPKGEISPGAGVWGGSADGTGPFFQQAVLSFPKQVLTGLSAPLQFQLKTRSKDDETSVSQRTVYRIGVLPFVADAPTVDADLSEYSGAPAMNLDSVEQALTAEWRSGGFTAEDLSGSIRGMWSKDGLWLGCDITDDHPMMNDQGAGQTIYMGDAVEVYLCPRGYWGQYYANRENGAYHFALSPGRDGNGALISDFEKQVPGSQIAVRRTERGYRMEGFIPGSAFGGYQAKVGDVVGWDVQIDDRDDYSASGKQKAMMWNGDNMNWLRAGKWGMAVVK
jgi:hypothetical protein